jgi:hypothetical protein
MDRLYWIVAGMVSIVCLSCAQVPGDTPKPQPFTIAMIPDTQNYVDYSHQMNEGFAIDAADLFIEQLAWVAERARSKGGDIAFVASVGDTWQHGTKPIDEGHVALGVGTIENPLFRGHFDPTPKVLSVEIPKATEGYQLIADAGLPFGVPPGNHDYDAMYNVDTHPPNLSKPPRELTMSIDDIGLLHVGGLDNFLSAFGANRPFFADKPWYVGSFGGGTSSAQIFNAGGYSFLHLALEMQPSDAVLEWAREILAAHPGRPTILSTHDYLAPNNERIAGGLLDFTLVDPENHNSPEQMWQKLISQEDQIFLVLCGHYHGQGLRIESNQRGNEVYQVLADFQDRGQAGLDAGQLPGGGLAGGLTGIGDGWLRLLEFNTATAPPTIQMRTYSTHYKKFSSELPTYAGWYREHEQKDMTDEEFLAADEYVLELTDFRARFGLPTH